jgi:hypothetical protein
MPSASGMTEATHPALGVWQFPNHLQVAVHDGLDHELGDPFASFDDDLGGRVGVDEQHLQLPAVSGVNEAGGVEARDTVSGRQPAAGLHKSGVPIGDRHSDSGRHQHPAAAGREHHRLPGPQVQAGIAVTRIRRQLKPGIQTHYRNHKLIRIHPPGLGAQVRFMTHDVTHPVIAYPRHFTSETLRPNQRCRTGQPINHATGRSYRGHPGLTILMADNCPPPWAIAVVPSAGSCLQRIWSVYISGNRIPRFGTQLLVPAAATLMALVAIVLGSPAAQAQEYAPCTEAVLGSVEIPVGDIGAVTGECFLPDSTIEIYLVSGASMMSATGLQPAVATAAVTGRSDAPGQAVVADLTQASNTAAPEELLGTTMSTPSGTFTFEWNTTGRQPGPFTLRVTDGTNTAGTEGTLMLAGAPSGPDRPESMASALPTTGAANDNLVRLGVVLLTMGGFAVLASRGRWRRLLPQR